MQASLACRTVLIVDDERVLREMLEEMLQDEGFETHGAANGQEALKLLSQEPRKYCLVLLDMMMPIMNGLQFRMAQRDDLKLAPIPVVAMSADPQQLQAIQMRDVAAKINKPLDYADLIETVKQHARLQS